MPCSLQVSGVTWSRTARGSVIGMKVLLGEVVRLVRNNEKEEEGGMPGAVHFHSAQSKGSFPEGENLSAAAVGYRHW